MLTPSLEDYLEEVYRLCLERGRARATDLAAHLNVSLPSVTKALQKLTEDGYIQYEAYGEASLTDRGRDVGRYLVTRNRVLRSFVELLGVACDVPEEVESMEHYISPRVVMGIDRLIKYLREDEHPGSFNRFSEERRLEEPPSSVAELASIKHMRRFGGKVLRADQARI